MFTRYLKAIGLSLGAALLVLAPAAGAAPASQAQGAPTAQKAVAVLLDHFASPNSPITQCNAVSGQLAGCPITPRLLNRLQNPIPNVENGNIVSRSQNPPQSLSYKEIDNDGKTAHVDSLWQYGAGSTYDITFVAVNTPSGWLVDDSYCAGNPSTSIYNTPTGPCQAIPGTPGTPGMPNTGSPADGWALPFMVAGSLALILGMVAVASTRRTKTG